MSFDYTVLDKFFMDLPKSKKVLNEDAETAAMPSGSAPAPTVITNPPAETTPAQVTDPVPAWLSDALKYWQDQVEKNPDNKEIAAELARVQEMITKATTMKEAKKEWRGHTVNINIETSNDAFANDEERELTRTLKELISKDGWTKKTKIMDVNGNSIGTIEFSPL